MAVDTHTQLREYGDRVLKLQNRITSDEIMTRTKTIQTIPDDDSTPRLGPNNRRYAAIALVAGVIVVVLLNLLLAGRRSDPPVVATTGAPETTAPATDEINTDSNVVSGAIQTPLGVVDWWHVTGRSDEMPGLGWIVPSPEGFLLIDDQPHLETGETVYWQSPDAIKWTQIETPGPEDPIWQALQNNDDNWLVVHSPNGQQRIYLSADGANWDEIESPQGASSIRLNAVGDQVFAIGNYRVWLRGNGDWAEILPMSIPFSTVPGEPLSGDPVDLGGTIVIPWTFLPDSQNGTDEVMSTINIIAPDGSVSSVDAPWNVIQRDGRMPVTVVAVDGRLVAYTQDWNGVETTIEQWISSDGKEWTGPTRSTGPTRPPFEEKACCESARFFEYGGFVFAYTANDDGRIWVSQDGTSWADTGVNVGRGFEFIPLGDGAILTGAGRFYVSADLVDWVEIEDGPDLTGTKNWLLGRSRIDSAADTSFFMSFDSRFGSSDLWGFEIRN